MTHTNNFSGWSLAAAGAIALAIAAPHLPADDVADIVITEVMYNPASGDSQEDFIEIYNQSPTETYNLAGFKFTSGVAFTFPNVSIGPQKYLVVCGSESRIRQLHGITNTVGNWDPASTLKNGGERLRLENAAGVEVEDFTYDDRAPWPILADGYGHSLERRNPAFDNDDPANWAASEGASTWTLVTLNGLATSTQLYLYLTGPGTAYVDDIKLYPVGNPGDNRLGSSGGFESASLTPWVADGNHSGSATTTAQKKSGSRSLKVVSTGAGGTLEGSVHLDTVSLTPGRPYTLELQVLITQLGQTMVARLESSEEAEFYVEARGGAPSPGKQNSVFAADIPPFIYPAEHSPVRPTASSPVTLLAGVKDDVSVASVTAHWDAGAGEETAAMLDDGAHGDQAAGDGLYGASIGTFGTGTLVRYWFTAADGASQEGRFPFRGNPTRNLGFYIEPAGISPAFEIRSNSGLTSARAPVYHLLVNPAFLNGSPPHLVNLTQYVGATFVFDGEVFDNVRVRHRGQTSLGVPKKHWKIDFNKDHRFRTPFEGHPEVDNINLQSSYGDKSFLREWLAYKAWMDVGLAGLEMWHVRLYLNGAYRGLYVHLENPNGDWLDRTGLDAEGWLWKSYSEAKGGTGGFELKADGGNAAAANAALGGFVSNMNTLTGQNLIDYINTNVNVPSFTDFLALTQLIHNCDHPAKNYLVYADEDSPAGSWTYLLWDADLTHGRNYECAGGGVYNDTIRTDMFGDTQLLFGTSAKPKCDGPWNGVINGFLQKTTAFRRPFYERTKELLDQLYSPAVLNPLIDDLAANLGSPVNEVEMDWNKNAPYGNRANYAFHVNELKKFVQLRYNYLTARLDTLLGTAPDIDNLACARSGDNAVLTWTRHGTYDSIKVYLNDTLLRTLSGSANGYTAPLDLDATVNSFRVASVAAGTERAGKVCAINVEPVLPAAAFAASVRTGVAPLAVVFTNQSTGAASYVWDFGDGTTSAEESPAHTYVSGGEYTVTLTARSAGGLEDTEARPNYIQIDGVIAADFIAMPRAGSAPLSVQFMDATAGSIAQSWLWDFGDGATSLEQNPIHTYVRDGAYTVSLQTFGFVRTDTETKAAYIQVSAPGGRFIRGDSNGDGKLDISDGVYTLNYLFSGGVFPDCLDALDTDDTGKVDLSDAVRVLGYLFQGGPAPASPFPAAGPDGTADGLSDCARA